MKGKKMTEKKHFWECECGYRIDFRQPELPQHAYSSEQNKEKSCPECNDSMWFDEYPEIQILKHVDITDGEEDEDGNND